MSCLDTLSRRAFTLLWVASKALPGLAGNGPSSGIGLSPAPAEPGWCVAAAAMAPAPSGAPLPPLAPGPEAFAANGMCFNASANPIDVAPAADPLALRILESLAHFRAVTYPPEAAGLDSGQEVKAGQVPAAFQDLQEQDDFLDLEEKDPDPMAPVHLQRMAQWGSALTRVAGMDNAAIATLSSCASAGPAKRQAILRDGMTTIQRWGFYLNEELQAAEQEARQLSAAGKKRMAADPDQPLSALSAPARREILRIKEDLDFHNRRVVFMNEAVERYVTVLAPLESAILPQPPPRFPDEECRRFRTPPAAKAVDPALGKQERKQQLRARILAKFRGMQAVAPRSSRTGIPVVGHDRHAARR